MAEQVPTDGAQAAPPPPQPPTSQPPAVPVVGDPVWVAWREGTLTRAAELEALCTWVRRSTATDAPAETEANEALSGAVMAHLEAAREATRCRRWFQRYRTGARLERAMSNLDAAEAHILHLAPSSYLLGQMPSLLNHVQRHLEPTDPRRRQMEKVAAAIELSAPDDGTTPDPSGTADADRLARITRDRGQIVSSARGASSAALREQLQVRSFRSVIILTTAVMAVISVGLGVLGWVSPETIPLCFAPEEARQTTIVCPTQQQGPVAAPSAAPPPEEAAGGAADRGPSTEPQEDIDALISDTTRRADVALVQLVGLTAAAIAAAGTIGGIRGSSEPYGVPLTLALLKLPSGAVTAVLGLLLMRGEFVPGLSALDTSAQIVAWALVFGYAQQLFTRLADHQAHHVLDRVRGASNQGSETAS